MPKGYLQIHESDNYILKLLEEIDKTLFTLSSIYAYYLEKKDDKDAAEKDLFTSEFVTWALARFFNKLNIEFHLQQELRIGFFVLDYKYKVYKEISDKFSSMLPKQPIINSIKLAGGLYAHRINTEFKADVQYQAKLAKANCVMQEFIREVSRNMHKYQNNGLDAAQVNFSCYLSSQKPDLNFTLTSHATRIAKRNLTLFPIHQSFEPQLKQRKLTANEVSSEKMEINFLLNSEPFMFSK